MRADVTLWLDDVEITAALEGAILRDVDARTDRTYWTDREKSDMYLMVAYPQTLEFYSVSV